MHGSTPPAPAVAVDNFLVQDPLGRPFREEEAQLDRLRTSIEGALANRVQACCRS